jgi:hypothetical protein
LSLAIVCKLPKLKLLSKALKMKILVPSQLHKIFPINIFGIRWYMIADLTTLPNLFM